MITTTKEQAKQARTAIRKCLIKNGFAPRKNKMELEGFEIGICDDNSLGILFNNLEDTAKGREIIEKMGFIAQLTEYKGFSYTHLNVKFNN